jgi:hypothetical protein
MKFIMVMIICFGFDCQAVYDSEFEYQTYDECVAEAVGVTEYMQLIFPASSGEIHCWDRETFNIFEEQLKKDGLPHIEPVLPSGTDT